MFCIYLRTNNDLCHSINRLGFITEVKSVYSAVRTGSLNKAVCAPSLKVKTKVISYRHSYLANLDIILKCLYFPTYIYIYIYIYIYHYKITIKYKLKQWVLAVCVRLYKTHRTKVCSIKKWIVWNFTTFFIVQLLQCKSCHISNKYRFLKCTLLQPLRLCRGRTTHRGSRGIALGTRRWWRVSLTPRPLFTPRKDPVHIVEGAGWVPGPVWTGAENFAPTGIRSPDLPARSQSLYRLRYPAHRQI
jgi:hypothetical protein